MASRSAACRPVAAESSTPAISATRSSGSLLPVGGEPFIDQRDRGIDDGVVQPLLRGDQLHQLVRALDIGHAVVERARGRGRTREALRRGGVFLERYQIIRRGAELDAQIVDE